MPSVDSGRDAFRESGDLIRELSDARSEDTILGFEGDAEVPNEFEDHTLESILIDLEALLIFLKPFLVSLKPFLVNLKPFLVGFKTIQAFLKTSDFDLVLCLLLKDELDGAFDVHASGYIYCGTGIPRISQVRPSWRAK